MKLLFEILQWIALITDFVIVFLHLLWHVADEKRRRGEK